MLPISVYIGEVITTWGRLFAAPLHNPSILWILIPVYLNWIFTEFYQEKRGTSLGNAISNSLIPAWVGWDWLRTIYNSLQIPNPIIDVQLGTKAIIAAVTLMYGISILIQGIKLNKKVQFIGRIRVVTYFVLMMTPLYYGIVSFSFLTFVSIILCFPIFYFVVEVIDKIIPDPAPFKEDNSKNAEAQEITQPSAVQQADQQIQPPSSIHPFPPQKYYPNYPSNIQAQRQR